MNTPNPMQRLGKAFTAPSFIFPRPSVFPMLLLSSWLSLLYSTLCLLFDSFILCYCLFLAIQGSELLARQQHIETTREGIGRSVDQDRRRRRRAQPDARPCQLNFARHGFYQIYIQYWTTCKDIVCISFAVYLRNSYFC